MANINRFKVEIEFGKEYSIVAWAHTMTPKNLSFVSDWSNSDTCNSNVPSKISYTVTGEVQNWGHGVRPDEERVVSLDLLLGSSEPATLSHEPATTQEEVWIPSSKTPVDIITDYLSSLRNCTIETLMQSYGRLFLDETPIDYTLIVPAGLSEDRKEMILQAAKCAGLRSDKTTEIMSDIGATTIWTLRKHGLTKFKPHDTIILIDFGTDTINFRSYGILTLIPVTLEEYCTSSQESYDSSPIKRTLEDFLKIYIGEPFDKLELAAQNKLLHVSTEYLMRYYPDRCPVPGLPDDDTTGIYCGVLRFTSDNIKGILGPAMDEVVLFAQKQIDIVESQYQQELNAVNFILTGEYNASHYLPERLAADLKKKGGGDLSKVSVIDLRKYSHNFRTPLQGSQIVSRKPQIIGQRTHTVSQRAKRYYGAETETEFLFGKHPLENLSYCPYTGERLCCHRMVWYIKEGDQLPENHTVHIPFRKRVGLDDAMIFTDVIFSWETVTPEYSNRPSNINSSVVKRFFKVVSDLSTIPKSSFTKKTGPAWAPHYEVEYNLVLKIKSDKPDFELSFQEKTYCVVIEYLDD